MNFVQDALIYLNCALGLFGGLFILSRVYKIKSARMRRINFVALGLLYLYAGTVYLMVILGFVSAIPPTEAAILLRPANLLFLAVPLIISWEMGI